MAADAYLSDPPLHFYTLALRIGSSTRDRGVNCGKVGAFWQQAYDEFRSRGRFTAASIYALAALCDGNSALDGGSMLDLPPCRPKNWKRQ